MKKKFDIINVIEITTIVLFLISLIPILWVSFYSHPVFDDFSYSKYVHFAVLDPDSSLFSLIKGALREVKESYHTWQGTFSAIFLFAFQPGVYKIPCYWLTAFIMIGSLTFSSIYLWIVIVSTIFKTRKELAVIIALLLLEMQIQFVPDIKEAFYWWNGTIYYTFFFSLLLVEIGVLIQLWNAKKHISLLVISATLLGIVIGGGNYSSALICSVLLFTTFLFLQEKMVVIFANISLSVDLFCYQHFCTGEQCQSYQ